MKVRKYKGKSMSEMSHEEIIALHYNLAINEHLQDSTEMDDFYEAVSEVQAELISRMKS